MTKKGKSRKRVLIVAAHPDDEVLGCGGTMAKMAEAGAEVHILILGEGMTSRQAARNPSKIKEDLKRLHSQVTLAAKKVRAKSAEVLNFPDNRFDSIPLLDLVKAVEKKKNEIKPATIFTHHRGDLNVDHRQTFAAVMTACRPMAGECVREIFSFEVPSSTEWQAVTPDLAFLPNVHMVIDERHLRAKIAAMECYSSERRKYPHPRSPEALRTIAQYRGIAVGADYAESFELIRKISP